MYKLVGIKKKKINCRVLGYFYIIRVYSDIDINIAKNIKPPICRYRKYA